MFDLVKPTFISSKSEAERAKLECNISVIHTLKFLEKVLEHY